MYTPIPNTIQNENKAIFKLKFCAYLKRTTLDPEARNLCFKTTKNDVVEQFGYGFQNKLELNQQRKIFYSS